MLENLSPGFNPRSPALQFVARLGETATHDAQRDAKPLLRHAVREIAQDTAALPSILLIGPLAPSLDLDCPTCTCHKV